MVQATTPTFILTLPQDLDLSDMVNMYFTLKQNSVEITKTGGDVYLDGNIVYVFMSQEDTVKIFKGSCIIQLNWTYPGGLRGCTKEKVVPVEDNLLKKVVL